VSVREREHHDSQSVAPLARDRLGELTVPELLEVIRRQQETPVVAGAPPGPRGPLVGWGAAPVALPRIATTLHSTDGALMPPPAAPRRRQCSSRDTVRAFLSDPRRRHRVAAEPGGSPVVAVMSLFGGVGASTTAGALARRWASGGRRVVLADATGAFDPHWPGELRAPRVAQWPDLRDDRQVAGLIAARLRAAPAVVIDGGRAGSCPPIQAVRAVVDAARRLHAVAVLDLPAGDGWLAATAPIGADVVALCCRAQPRQLRVSAECLRDLAAAGRCLPPVIGVVTGPGRAGAALAAGSDVTAGWVRLCRAAAGAGVTVLAAAADLAGQDKGGVR